MEDVCLVPAPELLRFCAGVLERVGLPAEDANIIADVLVSADLQGVETHGVMRLPIYIRRILEGGVRKETKLTILRETPATALVDGGNGPGPVVGCRAMGVCIDKARNAGIGWVSVRGSNHFGMAGYYARMALPHDMMGFSATNAPPTMAPWGGRKAMLGTNPIAVAIPSDREFPIVLDLATSLVARGKIILAAKKDEPIPDTWALDASGRPTRDAQAALGGTVQPMGGYKGSGMSLVVDLLCGALSGAAFGVRVGQLYGNLTTPQNLGHFFGAIDIGALADVGKFKAAVSREVSEIEASPPVEGVDRIVLPGQLEYEREWQRRRDGIPISEEVLRDLEVLGDRFGLRLNA